MNINEFELFWLSGFKKAIDADVKMFFLLLPLITLGDHELNKIVSTLHVNISFYGTVVHKK
jgi:hypothetical protein